MNNLYEALEVCLQDIEHGADIDTVLFRYPDLADELRPILEASANAREMAVPAPSTEVVRRNRLKVLQHAAQMREANVKSSQRIWFASFRRLAVTLAVVTTLLVSGTGLVNAASTTLPGDQLYPVKRTWEGVNLWLTFNSREREALEVEHENERLYELHELFAEGRSADVDFAGLVTSQNGSEWVVGGIPVIISAQTEIRDGQVVVGSAVRVRGQTQWNTVVLAERIELLPPNATLPDEFEDEDADHEGPNQQNEDNSGPGSGGEESESNDGSSNSGSGSGSDNSGSGSDDGNNDNSGSNNDNRGSNDNGDEDSGSGSGNDGSGGQDSDDDSSDGSEDDNSGSGGGGDDNSGSGGGGGGSDD